MRIKGLFFLAVTAVCLCASCGQNVPVVEMKCEYLDSPEEIDITNPRFQWQYSGKSEFMQKYYLLEVATDEKLLKRGRADVWSSGKVESECSFVEMFDNVPLMSMTSFCWRVTAWDIDGHKTVSPVAHFGTAKMEGDYWRSAYITAPLSDEGYFPSFRKSFTVDKKVRKAKLFIASTSNFQAFLNGTSFGKGYLNASNSDFSKRVYYHTFDVTDKLAAGENVLSLIVSAGLFTVADSFLRPEDLSFKSVPGFCCSLVIDGTDGRRTIVTSDDTWKYSYCDMKTDGAGNMSYVLDKTKEDWIIPGFDDSSWPRVTETGMKCLNTSSYKMPPVVIDYKYPAVKVYHIDDNTSILDCGVEMPGTYCLDFNTFENADVTVSFSRSYDGNGRLVPEYRDRIIYTAADSGLVFAPAMRCLRFRYVEISSDLPLSEVKLSVGRVSMAVPRSGNTGSSNPIIQGMLRKAETDYQNNSYGLLPNENTRKEGNLFEMGQIADFGLMIYTDYNIYETFMRDVADSQQPDGSIGTVIPYVGGSYTPAGIVDGFSVFHIPYSVYLFSGDLRCLAQSFQTCKRYLSYLEGTEGDDGLLEGDLLENSLYYHSFSLMSKAAGLLGKDDSHFKEKMDSVRNSANRKWFNADRGIYAGCTLYETAAALKCGIVPEGFKKQVGKYVDVNANSARTPAELALPEKEKIIGRHAILGLLTAPTTFYESVAYALGPDAPSDKEVFLWNGWCFSGVMMDADHPGYKHFIIRPNFSSDLSFSGSWHATPYGNIHSSWAREDGAVKVLLNIPVNTTATFITDKVVEYGSGRHEITILER